MFLGGVLASVSAVLMLVLIILIFLYTLYIILFSYGKSTESVSYRFVITIPGALSGLIPQDGDLVSHIPFYRKCRILAQVMTGLNGSGPVS